MSWPEVDALAREGERALQRPWPEAEPVLSHLAERQDRGFAGLAPYLARITYEGVPAEVLLAGRRRLALAATAARLHRIETGALPRRLEDLVPRYLDRPPIDPISNAPLRAAIDPASGDLVIDLAPLGALAPPRPGWVTRAAPPPAAERVKAPAGAQQGSVADSGGVLR